jgi:UDP-3-O-[3-hydroxymyristoyl] glucosamine N-acyltransferase
VLTLGDISQQLGLSLRGGAAELPISGLATLRGAKPGELSFFSNRHYLKQLGDTRASAVIVAEEFAGEFSGAVLISPTPYLSYAKASSLFDDRPVPVAGIHPTAWVDPTARLADDVKIGPHCAVGPECSLDSGVSLGAGTVLGAGSRIGRGSRLDARVTLCDGVEVGFACHIQSGAVLGSDGFGYAPEESGWVKIHQLGTVKLGDRVHIGANTCIDRGALGDTVIGNGVIIDNLVQIAHNVHIGENTAIAACCAIAGSTTIGSGCTIAGAVGIIGHLQIVDNVHVTAMSLITHSITVPGSYSSGTQMGETHEWRKNAVRFSQLDKIYKRLRELERAERR